MSFRFQLCCLEAGLAFRSIQNEDWAIVLPAGRYQAVIALPSTALYKEILCPEAYEVSNSLHKEPGSLCELCVKLASAHIFLFLGSVLFLMALCQCRVC